MESVAVPKRLAPEQKGVDNPVEGLSSDMYFFGLVFAFSITKGIEVFERDGRYNSTAKAILESLPESHQFFKNCIRTPVDLRELCLNLSFGQLIKPCGSITSLILSWQGLGLRI